MIKSPKELIVKSLFYLQSITKVESVTSTNRNEVERMFFKRDQRKPENQAHMGSSNNRNCVRCKVDGSFDNNYSVGWFENGIVYCHPPNGSDYIIGYYNGEQSNSVTVRCVSDKQVIGSIARDTNKITLSRQGLLDRLEKTGYPREAPDRITWVCAELFSNCILSLYEGECIALCEADNIGSAAAFICLHYETIDHGPYYDFYREWLH